MVNCARQEPPPYYLSRPKLPSYLFILVAWIIILIHFSPSSPVSYPKSESLYLGRQVSSYTLAESHKRLALSPFRRASPMVLRMVGVEPKTLACKSALSPFQPSPSSPGALPMLRACAASFRLELEARPSGMSHFRRDGKQP